MNFTKAYTVFGMILVGATLIGWPLSMFTFAKEEPPTTMALSWLSVLLVGIDILAHGLFEKKHDDET